MPLTPLQTRVLRLLAGRRSPASYVAGSTPLNQHQPRVSKDVDIFHDVAETVADTARLDMQVLAAAGLEAAFLRQDRTFQSAVIRDGNETLRLEWAHESDFRFFPAVPDETFGFRLHLADLVANKLLAAADRREARDAIDLLTIHRGVLPLGAVAWAAAEKSPGLSPLRIIAEVRRLARYSEAEVAQEELAEPMSAAALNEGLRAALTEAEDFLRALPPDMHEFGLFLDERGQPFQPAPAAAARARLHHGSRKGAWPMNDDVARGQLVAELAAWRGVVRPRSPPSNH